MKKRFLSWILALAMVLSLLPADLAVAAEEGLYYRYAGWDDATGGHFEDKNQSLYSDFETWPGSGSPVYFYYVDGNGTEINLHKEDLIIEDPSIARLEETSWPNMYHLGIEKLGETRISYNGYSIRIFSNLPEFGCYGSIVANEATFLREFAVTEEQNVFYIVGLNQRKITNVELRREFASIAEVEIMDDGAYAKVTVNEVPADRSYDYIVYYDGGSEWWSSIRLRNGNPGLAYRWPNWDGYPFEDPDGDLERAFTISKDSSDTVFFYFVDINGERLVTAENLSSSNPDVVRVYAHSENPDAVSVSAVNFGEAELLYTADDGSVYSMPVSVTLPEIGFYSTPEASEETYLTRFVVTNNNDTFYLVGRDGWKVTNAYARDGFANIATVTLAEDGSYAAIKVTGTAEGWYNVGYDAINEEQGRQWGGHSRRIEITSNKDRLAYRGCYWENGIPTPSEQELYSSMGGEPGDERILGFYLVINGEETLVPAVQLVSSDESVVTIEPHEKNGDVAMVRFHGFGCADISYTAEDGTEYTVPVDANMPYIGFYSQPEASEENFVKKLIVTDETNKFYVVCQDADAKIIIVELEEDLAEIAEYQIMNDGAYAVITITGTPAANRSYSVFVECANEEEGWSRTNTRGIQLINGKPHLAFRWVNSDNGVVWPSEGDMGTSMTEVPGTSHGRYFYFVSGGVETLVRADQLRSSDESVLTIEPHWDDSNAVEIYVHSFGQADIIYTAEDGTEYRVPLTSCLPDVGFYSAPVASEENYLQEFTVTEEDDTFYLVAQNDYKLTYVSLNGDFQDIAEYEIMNDGDYAVITVTGDPYSGRHYSVYYEYEREDGWSDWNYCDIRLNNDKTHLAYNHELNDNEYYTTNYIGCSYEQQWYVYLVGSDGSRMIAPDQLYSTNPDVLRVERLEWDANKVKLVPANFGEAELCYNDGDKVYSMKITVGLPSVGFYSQPVASEENYLYREFVVTEENNVFYMVSKDDFKIINVRLYDDMVPIADYEVLDGGKAVKITVTSDPNSGWYGLGLDVQFEDGNVDTNWGESLRLINGKPHLGFSFGTWDQNDNFVPEENGTVFTGMEFGVGASSDYFFYMVEGNNKTPVTYDQLTVEGDSVVISAGRLNPDAVRWNAVKTGVTIVSYTTGGKTYSVKFTVQLPEMAFYTTPEAKDETLIDFLEVQEDGNNTFYLVVSQETTGNYIEKILDINPGPELQEIANVTLDESGMFATFQVTGTPNNAWYDFGITIQNRHTGEEEGWVQSVQIVNAVRLVFRHADWTPENGYFENPEYIFESQLFSEPNCGYVGYFYFIKNGVETKLTASDLRVADPAIAALGTNGNNDAVVINVDGLGQTDIIYKDPATNKEYTFDVRGILPTVGFYNEPERNEENYISEFYVTEDGENIFYLVADTNWELTDVSLSEELAAIATLEMAEDHTYATITVHEQVEGNRWYNVYVEAHRTDNDGHMREWKGIRLINGDPALAFCYPEWGVPEHSAFEYELYGVKGSAREVWFYLTSVTDEKMLSWEDLRSSDESVVVIEAPQGDQDMVCVRFVGFGAAEIIYMDGDKEYRMPVYSVLPGCGFSTEPTLTEETYITRFVVTEESNTFYYVYNDEEFDVAITTITPTPEFDAIANFNISEDGKLVEIVVTGAPKAGEIYHLEWTGVGEGFEWFGGGMIDLINGLPVSDSVSTEVEEHEDGTTTITNTADDGSTAVTNIDENGKSQTDVELSEEAVEEAVSNGEAVVLPMTEVGAYTDSEAAAEVTVNLPDTVVEEGETIKVEVPVANANAGTVAVIVHADGTEEIIRTTVQGETGIKVDLENGATIKVVDNSKEFEDVSGDDWFNDAVMFASSREMVNGTMDGTTFSPLDDTSRGMIMTILARFNGVDTTPGEGEQWYAPGMEWSKAAGISDGTNPDNDLSREQLAVMLWRMIGSPTVENDMSQFSDVDQISSWALEAMRWATSDEVRLIQGYKGKMNPLGEASRSEVAQMLKNFIEGQWG